MFKILVSTILILSISDLTSDASSANKFDSGENFNFVNKIEEFDEYEDDFANYDWKFKGKFQLSGSKSTILVPPGYLLLIGKDAKECGLAAYGRNCDALILSPNLENPILCSIYNDGYINLDSWSKINPKKLINIIKKSALTEIQDVDWLQAPNLNKTKNTITWSVEYKSNQGNFVNYGAIKLGREGCVWFFSEGKSDSYNYNDFNLALDTLSFHNGYDYKDHIPSDKISNYEIHEYVVSLFGGNIIDEESPIPKIFINLVIAILVATSYKFLMYVIGRWRKKKFQVS